MTSMNKVFADLPVTVFEAMSQAARDNNAINLGQGFPDDPGPEDIRRAVVEPGDEVVVFQPVYDSYLPIIRQAGGIPRLLRLEPPGWRLTGEMLASVFNPKTKAVLFNNPLNPAAVVYPREDLELLARFCQEFDTIAICDEVWEHVV